jgi:hypothetical protein
MTAKSHSIARPALVRTRATDPSPSNALTERQLDAVLRIHIAVKAADLRAEDPLVGQRERIDDSDLEPALALGSGEFAADPARPDDRNPAASIESLAQDVAVGERGR